MKISISKVTLVVGSLIISIIGISGCGGGNPVGNDNNNHVSGKIYISQAKQNPSGYKMNFGLDTTYVIMYSAAFSGSERTGGNIPVSFNIKPSLVDSFNIQNSTSYSILPNDSYTLSTQSAIIPSGKKVLHRSS